jgi:hypothetical protein
MVKVATYCGQCGEYVYDCLCTNPRPSTLVTLSTDGYATCPGCHQSYEQLGERAGEWSWSEDLGYTCTCPDLAAEERERTRLASIAAHRALVLRRGTCDHGQPVSLCCACGGY